MTESRRSNASILSRGASIDVKSPFASASIISRSSSLSMSKESSGMLAKEELRSASSSERGTDRSLINAAVVLLAQSSSSATASRAAWLSVVFVFAGIWCCSRVRFGKTTGGLRAAPLLLAEIALCGACACAFGGGGGVRGGGQVGGWWSASTSVPELLKVELPRRTTRFGDVEMRETVLDCALGVAVVEGGVAGGGGRGGGTRLSLEPWKRDVLA